MEKYIKLSDVISTLRKNHWAFTTKAFYFSLIQQLESIEPVKKYYKDEDDEAMRLDNFWK